MAQKVTGFIKLQIPAGKATVILINESNWLHPVSWIFLITYFSQKTKNSTTDSSSESTRLTYTNSRLGWL